MSSSSEVTRPFPIGSMLALWLAILAFSSVSLAQDAGMTKGASSFCSQQNALETIRQQLDATRLFDDTTQRITVLVRAADLLWSHEQERSRAAFLEAFELAIGDSKERAKRESSGQRIPTPDQRYVVIGAVARRDLVWANKLTEEMLKREVTDGDEGETRNQPQFATGSKLIEAAFTLLSSDVNAAMFFARRSLSHPASVELPMFLYRVSESNQSLADQLYGEAFAAYRDRPMSEFLYLSAYPFGNTREAGDMPSYAFYRVPPGFVRNSSLQQLLVQNLLRRSQQISQNPQNPVQGEISDAGQLWLAFTRLDAQIQQSFPGMAPATQQARSNLFSLLSQDSQNSLTQSIARQSSQPTRTFDEQVEFAEKQANADKRDELLVLTIIRAASTETIDRLVGASDKISDSGVREQLLNWLYFGQSQAALKNNLLAEARRLAAKVNQLDQRAYLYSEIARESLKTIENQAQAREVLDEIASAATKADDSLVKARTLLAAAYLYAKIDMNRSISILADAIKCINHLERPDFSAQVVLRKIEGRNFGTFAVFKTPGFNPENTLRDIGKVAFDTALNQASNFSDKSLRALTTLALSDLCLQQTPQKTKPKKSRTN
jgi:hypothetical protein